MCGLIGTVGFVGNQAKEAFNIMFMLNTLRGAHGCGMFKLYQEWSIEKQKHRKYFDIDKSDLPSAAYIFEEDYDNFLGKGDIRVLMGHSRHATRGEIKIENNHPFVTKNKELIGMHNGTITGKFKNSDKYETDSEALFNLISDMGLTEALNLVNKEATNVAYALQYYNYDKDDGEHIHLIRNAQRPLYLATNKNNAGQMFWASTPDTIAVALARTNTKDFEISDLKPHTLVKIRPFEDLKNRIEIIPDYYTEPKRSYAYTGNYYGRYSGNYNQTGGGNGHRTDSPFLEEGETESLKDSPKDNAKGGSNNKTEKERGVNYPLASLFGRPGGKNNKSNVNYTIKIGKVHVTPEYFDQITGKGCCICTQPSIALNHYYGMKFLKDKIDMFVCENCDASLSDNEKQDFGLVDLVTPVEEQRTNTQKKVG